MKMPRLSPRYGLNPAIPVCFYCGEEKNEVILAGRLPDDAEAPRDSVWNMDPCKQCAEWMRLGVILVSVADDQVRSQNPVRTGKFVVVTEAGTRECVCPEELDAVLTRRFAFVTDRVWKDLELPTENSPPSEGAE